MDAEFPNYEAVIPKKNEFSFFEINRIDRVAVISEDKTRSMKLRTNNDLLPMRIWSIACYKNIQKSGKKTFIKNVFF